VHLAMNAWMYDARSGPFKPACAEVVSAATIAAVVISSLIIFLSSFFFISSLTY
jgi:hypothetical protein